MNVIPFEKKHLDPVFDLVDNALTETYHPNMIMDIWKMWPNYSLCVVKDGQIVGFISGGITSKNYARILLLAVDENYRNRGIGTKLLENIESMAMKKHCQGLTLEIREGNESAERFYINRGFSKRGEVPMFYTNGDGAVIMKKDF